MNYDQTKRLAKRKVTLITIYHQLWLATFNFQIRSLPGFTFQIEIAYTGLTANWKIGVHSRLRLKMRSRLHGIPSNKKFIGLT